MKALHLVFVSAAGALGLTAEAQAIPLPDSSSCNQNSTCFAVSNSNTGANARAIYASTAGTTGPAIYGFSSDAQAINAYSNTDVGVYSVSYYSNAVVAQNWRTDWNAAALSAIPGNSNGLAIWAGGGAVKPGGGSWSSTSDARVKKDVKDFRAGLTELKRLRPVSYKYNGLGATQDDGNVFVGVIAQELEKVLPSMVKSSKVKLRPGDGQQTDLKRVDPSAFTYVLINAVKEQQKIIERQEARIAKLEQRSAPSVASLGSLGGLALGLVPLGFIVMQRRRKQSSADASS